MRFAHQPSPSEAPGASAITTSADHMKSNIWNGSGANPAIVFAER